MTHKILIELDETCDHELRRLADDSNRSLASVASDIVSWELRREKEYMDVKKRGYNPARPTIYISGPITHDPDYKEKFHDAQVLLASCGFEVLNPAELVKVSPEKDYTDYLAEAVWHMLKADELYMLKGWSTSKGAKLELKLARLLGKKVNFA